MPKSVEIDDFAAKLGLVTKRLNWSSSKLAQQVGVDKSVVARWLNGDSRPTAHSLMQLTAVAARTVEGLTAEDWELPAAQFRHRLGMSAVTTLTSGKPQRERATIEGLKYPADERWGAPYLGLWIAFYQSVINHGVTQVLAFHFGTDDLGMLMRFHVGPYFGEGPLLASSSHLHGFCECGPSYDRLVTIVLNGVREPQARVLDGLLLVMAGDTTGTPTATPVLLYRIDDGIEFDPVTDMNELGVKIGRLNEHAKAEAERTGNRFAVMGDIAPVEILRTVCPVVGVPRDDGGIDHTLRMPLSRSRAAGTLTLEGEPADSPMRTIPANLRRALGLEPSRPVLRVLGRAGK